LPPIIVGASGRRRNLPPEISSKEARLLVLALRKRFRVCFPIETEN
jgi:hypothetical protein